jgi:hypothetical protein
MPSARDAKSSFFILLAVIFLGSLVFFRTTPVSCREGVWGHHVLVNWQDFGFCNLKGQLVFNSGGYNLPEHPDVYAGHRAFGLYPAYFVDRIFGGCADGLPFYLALSLVIGISTWWLLGFNFIGMVAAVFVVFSPAYPPLVSDLCLFTIPVLLGIPFLGGVCGLLERGKLTLGSWILLLGMVAAYAPLNWTTIGAFGITLAYLAVAMSKNLKRVLLFALIVGVAGMAVLAVSLVSKVGNAAPATAVAGLYNGYLFGPLGYDHNGMTWMKAITRLTVANAVGLLPLWLLLLWAIWGMIRREKKITWNLTLPLLPLAAAALFIGGLRNYFAHHPPMAGSVLIYGIVFSLRLLLNRAGSANVTPGPNAPRDWLRFGAIVLACFAYGLVIMSVFKISKTGEDEILYLAKENTARHDVIFFSPQDDPWIAQNALRLQSLMDRALVPLPDEPAKELPGYRGARFRLTNHALPGEHNWVAQTEILPSQGFIARLLEWYRTHISKRAPGDRFETEKLYLYRMP